jgi:hypothetical protein
VKPLTTNLIENGGVLRRNDDAEGVAVDFKAVRICPDLVEGKRSVDVLDDVVVVVCKDKHRNDRRRSVRLLVRFLLVGSGFVSGQLVLGDQEESPPAFGATATRIAD